MLNSAPSPRENHDIPSLPPFKGPESRPLAELTTGIVKLVLPPSVGVEGPHSLVVCRFPPIKVMQPIWVGAGIEGGLGPKSQVKLATRSYKP